MYRGFIGKIMDDLDRAEALSELNPISSGNYYTLTCPSCGQNSAYISKSGYYIYCNRKNKCSYTSGLIEYVSNRDNISENDSIKLLANIAGIELPQSTYISTEQDEQKQNKEQLFKEILQISRALLWNKQANNVREYLNNRGYQDIEIIKMNFGFLPPIEKLRKLFLDKHLSPILIDDVLYSFSNNHQLLIPMFNQYGAISGFASRSIESSIQPKYLYTKGLERGSYFFNISEAKHTNTLIIVEGIIDALILTNRGINGVVACGGDSPTPKQIEDALKNKKIKNIILNLDSDEAGINGTKRAIEILNNYNVNIYVVNMSSYKDPDDYLKYNTIEDYKQLLLNAEKSIKWLSTNIIMSYDINTDIGRDNALDELLLLQHNSKDPIDTEDIINLIVTQLGISIETIQNKIKSFNEKHIEEVLLQEYKQLLNSAFKQHSTGDIKLLETMLSDGLINIRTKNVNNVLLPYSVEQACNDIENRPTGLNTGYDALDEYVTIPAGAVTLVAGRPSHGKTTFLLNLLLNMVYYYKDKSFYFFSYEESKTALFIKIINALAETVINDKLRYKNAQQIEYYLRGGIQPLSPTFKNGLPNPYYSINNAIDKYNKYVNEKRLWLIDNPLDIHSLSSAIEYANREQSIGGIFIDYAQRIKYSGNYDSERIKIARISETLRETATKLDLPIIVGAQLNRDNSKIKPQLDNLKEAGNLEEDANVVLGIYNWKTAIDKEKLENDTNRTNCKGESVSIDDRNIDFEVHILKNRNGIINESALLSFDAPILKIKEDMKKEVSPF